MKSWVKLYASALGFALVVLLATRAVGVSGWAAEHGMYQAQGRAMLEGRLALSTKLEGLAHDLAWTPDGTQQVWGLGAAIWQLPVTMIGKLTDGAGPDRVALLLWLALCYAVLWSGLRRALGRAGLIATVGAFAIAALLPGFVSLLRGRIGVYEEAAAYAYGAGLLLAGWLLQLAVGWRGGLAGAGAATATDADAAAAMAADTASATASATDADTASAPATASVVAGAPGRLLFSTAMLALFAGASGQFRPTVWFYGAATTALLCILVGRARRLVLTYRFGVVALIAALFAVGSLSLWASNRARFGDGFEFGHRLNLHSLPGNIVATRFSYPFERVSTTTAATELVGGMFGSPERNATKGFYQTQLHAGQADVPRWREYYFTTYNWAYLALGVIALGLWVAALRRAAVAPPAARPTTVATTSALILGLGAWGLLAALPLLAFYLRSPSVSSRYFLDLGPAMAALLIIVWLAGLARAATHRRGSAIAIGVLLTCLAITIGTAKVRRRSGGRVGLAQASQILQQRAATASPSYQRDFPVSYDRRATTMFLYSDTETHVMVGSGDTALTYRRPKPAAGQPSAPWQIQNQAGVVVGTAPPWPYLNGFGWDFATGAIGPATYFYVHKPQTIRIVVSRRDGAPVKASDVRVNLGRHHLSLIAQHAQPSHGGLPPGNQSDATGHTTELRFAVPAALQTWAGVQVAFVAFGPDTELNQSTSSLLLHAIAWGPLP